MPPIDEHILETYGWHVITPDYMTTVEAAIADATIDIVVGTEACIVYRVDNIYEIVTEERGAPVATIAIDGPRGFIQMHMTSNHTASDVATAIVNI